MQTDGHSTRILVPNKAHVSKEAYRKQWLAQQPLHVKEAHWKKDEHSEEWKEEEKTTKGAAYNRIGGVRSGEVSLVARRTRLQAC